MAKVLWKRHGGVVFTMPYTHVTWFGLSRKNIKPGTSGVITRVYSGFLDVTHLDVRLKDGTFLREVPIRYFAV